jgi:hypothetical protein
MVGSLVKNKFERTGREAIGAEFDVLSWHLPGRKEQRQKKT